MRRSYVMGLQTTDPLRREFDQAALNYCLAAAAADADRLLALLSPLWVVAVSLESRLRHLPIIVLGPSFRGPDMES